MVAESELEEWKPVVGYDGLYEISSFGRVRRVAGVLTNGHRWRAKILKQWTDPKGYCHVSLCRDNKAKRHAVHVVVCTAFHGPKPSLQVVAHLDGKPGNNRDTNLKWATGAENQSHRWTHGTMCEGEKNKRAVLTSKDVDNIRTMRKLTGFGCRRIAGALMLSASTVGHVIAGDTWKHHA